MAVPIFDYTRKVVGALSISAPSVRLSLEKLRKEYVPLVKKACFDISAGLGYQSLEPAKGD